MISEHEILTVCHDLWGARPEQVAFPGGRSRKSILLCVKGQQYVLSKRKSTARARLEAEVLRSLSGSGRAPELVALIEQFVVQGFVSGQRLSQVLHSSSKAKKEETLAQVVQSILDIQRLGQETGLVNRVPPIGARLGWHNDLADSPARLAKQMGIHIPSYDPSAVLPLLLPATPVLSKWDARPGNVIVTEEAHAVWIDWEHCGVGAPEDDLVWLFADEWTMDCSPACEKALLALAEGTETQPDSLRNRFIAKAVCHAAIRLGLMLMRRDRNAQPDEKRQLALDHVGTTDRHFHSLAKRMEKWADELSEFASLNPLFRLFEDRLAVNSQ
jgi:aminoglycoside phosphotransferase (APT) family kinase protein